MPEDWTQTFICHGCVGEEFLIDEIREIGTRNPCRYCSRTQEAIELWDFAERIHQVIQAQFVLTPLVPEEWYEHLDRSEGNWTRRGMTAKDLVAELAEVSDRAASEVRALLSDIHGYPAVKGGGEDPYDYEACYEERGPNDDQFRDTWEEFRRDIIGKARFFSRVAEDRLGDIFGEFGDLRTSQGEPVVREFEPGSTEGSFWRARRIEKQEDLETILKDPAGGLGPPPSKYAKNNRMNARGITVFYGANCKDTCIAEIRAPVGSRVVVGRFLLLRTIRLIDLQTMSKVYVEGSRFHPKYVEQKGRASFLKQLVVEISKPVMPEDEELEYIPTQVVAEYLANRADPNIDGILYPSSQTDGDGMNVVLFNHACQVNPYKLPEETEIRIFDRTPDSDLDLPYAPSISVKEVVPDDHPPVDNSPSSEATLDIDIESVSVLDIKSVTYSSDSHEVERSRITRSEEDNIMASISGFDIDSILGDYEVNSEQ